MNRGRLRLDGGDLAGALEDFDRAVELSPDLWVAWTNRGIALARRGDRDLAIRSFEEAIRRAPEDARAGIERTRRESLGQ